MEDLSAKLSAPPTPSIAALPDGSVDHRYRLRGPDGQRLSREDVGRRISAGAKTFSVEFLGSEPGGQAVNAARQTHALGAETLLIGHLDHEVLAELPFETISMGEPADVAIYEFSAGGVMFANESADIREWSLEGFESAVGDRLWTVLERDAIVACNWATVPALTTVLGSISAHVPDDMPVVLDPGAVSAHSQGIITRFLDELSAMEIELDVVLSPNRSETDALATAVGIEESNRRALAQALLDELGIAAVVVHDRPEAVVATEAAVVSVPNIEATNQVRHVGGGDRFTAGLAFGLAADWSWTESLSLANATSTYYLEHGTSPTPTDLQAFFAEHVDGAAEN